MKNKNDMSKMIIFMSKKKLIWIKIYVNTQPAIISNVRAHAVPGVQRDVHCRLQEVLYGCGVASSQVLSPSVSLLDTTNLDLNEEEVDNMLEDQTASADTLMVLLTLFSQAEVFFPGERIY